MNLPKKHINSYREDALEFVTARIKEYAVDRKDQTVIIAVAGPGASGKSTFSHNLRDKLEKCSLINLDDYRTSRQIRVETGLAGSHPEAVKLDIIIKNIIDLKHGLDIEKPVYEPVSGTDNTTEKVICSPIILLDGEAAAFAEFQPYIDFLIFIDVTPQTQLKIRLDRDVKQNGHSRDKVQHIHNISDLQDFPAYGADSRKYADIILQFHSDLRHTVKILALD